MKVLINLQFCNLEFDLILGFDLKQLGVPVFPTEPEEVKVYLLDLCGGWSEEFDVSWSDELLVFGESLLSLALLTKINAQIDAWKFNWQTNRLADQPTNKLFLLFPHTSHIRIMRTHMRDRPFLFAYMRIYEDFERI